jgi:indole-3-glycerol phosphate synthase
MILERILETKRSEVERLYKTNSVAGFLAEARSIKPPLPVLPILQSHREQHDVAVIAEVKQASPSKGVIRSDFDPVAIAKTYERHGAAILSVLTDQLYFQGSITYLRDIREAVNLPLLRKDFIIDEIQVAEARAHGADMVLLIVAALDDAQLRDLYDAVRDLGMTALLEVHTLKELERALPLNPACIGINNRDLRTFQVDRTITQTLAAYVPDPIYLVSESGIESRSHVEEVQMYGADAVLVGESLMRADDIGAALLRLRGVIR